MHPPSKLLEGETATPCFCSTRYMPMCICHRPKNVSGNPNVGGRPHGRGVCFLFSHFMFNPNQLFSWCYLATCRARLYCYVKMEVDALLLLFFFFCVLLLFPLEILFFLLIHKKWCWFFYIYFYKKENTYTKQLKKNIYIF